MIFDFTMNNDLSKAMTSMVDDAIVQKREAEPSRDYLGGSRLGHPKAEKQMDRGCGRQLWYEFHHTQKDEGRDFPGKLYRVFDMGHDGEDRLAANLRMAGFNLLVEKEDGSQFGWTFCEDEDGKPRIRGHIDGVFVAGPDCLTLPEDNVFRLVYPFLWECKCLSGKKWQEFAIKGCENSHPVYYGQVQVYMHCMGLTDNPALLTAMSRETGEVCYQFIEYNQAHAIASLERGVQVVQAEKAIDLDRAASDYTYLPCKWCDYQETCKADEANKPAPNPDAKTEMPSWLTT